MLQTFMRTVVGLFWAALGGYIVFDFGNKLARHENPFSAVAFLVATLVVLQILHDAVRGRSNHGSAHSDFSFPYALVAMSAIVTYSWLELKSQPPFLTEHRVAITAAAGVLVLILLALSYLTRKVSLPYLGLSLVALVLFAWGWHFATWLWMSLSIFYSYGYEYTRYLIAYSLAREHNIAYPNDVRPVNEFPEAFTFLTFFTFTGLTLAWLQTTRLPYPAWAYWVVLTLLMLSLYASWLRLRRPKPLPPRYFVLARSVRLCTPKALRP